MNPIYAARIVKVKAENAWRAVDRNPSATMEERTVARLAYEKAKRDYLAAFKIAGSK